ncbi:DUF6639 family protein [Tropicimonas sp. IMCC6043]|uniref:DUF6639 family protein n=1 Tax=Tropicimonas sp. IMCC6043 TaxID=2510645 RepID=UPI00101CF97C|nr:DUF6639 family protein [Tropicimonas sp. IMCC6043]RYH08816.1 hypothetical protein EU800_15150 [Tropicimonas sp. IMCC6043]
MHNARHCWIKAATLAVTVGSATVSGAADPVPCDDPGFWVDASEGATQSMICAAALDARRALDRCGLSQTEPITIEVVYSPIHNIGECLASFDCELGRIQIIDRDLLRDHLLADDAYAALPDDVVFCSLLTHELAHALIEQKLGGRKIAPVDHEYIANALELAALAPEHRKTLLDAAGIEPPISAEVIDIFIYGLAPRRFAAASYLYFEAHGCETVTGILDGSTSFRIVP